MTITEYKDACKKAVIEKSAVAEHASINQHPVLWAETTLIDQARRQTKLFLKEALHIHLTPKDQLFKLNTGTDLPGCWVPTLHASHTKLMQSHPHNN